MATLTQIGGSVAVVAAVLLGPRVGTTGAFLGAAGTIALAVAYKSLKSKDNEAEVATYTQTNGVKPKEAKTSETHQQIKTLDKASASSGVVAESEKKYANDADLDFSDDEKSSEQTSRKKKGSKTKLDSKKQAQPVKKEATPTVPKAAVTKTGDVSAKTGSIPAPQGETKAVETVADVAKSKKKKSKKKISSGDEAEVEKIVPQSKPVSVVPQHDEEEGWQTVSRRKKRSTADSGSATDAPAPMSADGELDTPIVSPTKIKEPEPMSKANDSKIEPTPVPDSDDSDKEMDQESKESSGAAKKKKKSKKKKATEPVSSSKESVIMPQSTTTTTAAEGSDEWTVVGRKKRT